jgi:hypothetical protein
MICFIPSRDPSTFKQDLKSTGKDGIFVGKEFRSSSCEEIAIHLLVPMSSGHEHNPPERSPLATEWPVNPKYTHT